MTNENGRPTHDEINEFARRIEQKIIEVQEKLEAHDEPDDQGQPSHQTTNQIARAREVVDSDQRQ